MNLQLVKPATPRPHAPSVLNESFQSRIHRINHAIRELRHLGVKVAWADIKNATPGIVIQRDSDISIKPLLDRMTGEKRFEKHLLGTVISGFFEGVLVSWLEPSQGCSVQHEKQLSYLE